MLKSSASKSLRELLDRPRQQPPLRVRARAGRERAHPVAGLLLFHHQPVRAAQEARDAGHAVGRPGRGAVQRSDEHLVEAHRVGAELGDHLVGADHVAAALGHLLDHFLEIDVHRRRERRAVLPAHLVGGDPLLGELLARADVDRRLAVEAHVAAREVLRRAGRVVAEHAVALALDHPGVEQLLERLLGVHQAQVEEHLVPEARVQQVEHRVLRAADVQVDVHPVALGLARERRRVVARVGEAQVVPAAPRPLRHGVGVAARGPAGLGVGGREPVGRARQRRLEAAVRLEVVELGQPHRQLGLGHELHLPVVGVDHRERLAPVALPAEQPVAQLVGDRALADAVLLEPRGHLVLGLRGRQTVEEARSSPRRRLPRAGRPRDRRPRRPRRSAGRRSCANA